ncbi:hypothetical protein MKW94_029954 [Papaver nudicaule]|uniref:N-acetyltransferase domain-containing protein n=1 Tax=Papaver nudicaule TaxID=74823 RepID=A0AA41RQB1_PAPNU|nr:hypothetical protein [Papaver nudicaule]MCL7035044.1 hypothetical protein [Papaver nudicaule]
MCVIAVRKEGGIVQNGMFENIIGTLNVHVKYTYHLDNFPEYLGNRETSIIFNKVGPQYAVLSNVVVDKCARQQCIPKMYVHVRRDNKPALALYRKMGFEILADATAEPLMEQHNLYLCCINLQ